jgi:hypothetical protein
MAVDPGMHYLGVAILEGEDLLWFGIKTFPGRKRLPFTRQQVQQYLTTLLQKYQPVVLVVEEPFYGQSLLSANLRTLTREMKTWGGWKRPPCLELCAARGQSLLLSRSANQTVIGRSDDSAVSLLARYLTVLPWRCRYWFHMFDAVGQCAHVLSKTGSF